MPLGKFSLLALLVSVTLAGCVDSPTMPAWAVAAETSYEFQGREGASSFHYSVRPAPGGLEVTTTNHEPGFVRAYHALPTGAREYSQGETLRAYAHGEEAYVDGIIGHWIGFNQIRASKASPLGLGWIAASLLSDGSVSLGEISADVSIAGEFWQLTGRAPCYADCIIIDGETTHWLDFTASGTLGEVWPDNLEYRLPGRPDWVASAVRTEVSEAGHAVDPAAEVEEIQPGPMIDCGASLCGEDGVPRGLSIKDIVDALDDSPVFQQWNGGRSWFPISYSLSDGPSTYVVGQPVEPLYRNFVVVAHQGEVPAIFRVDFGRLGDEPFIAVALEGNPGPDIRFEDNPWKGPFVNFTEIYAGAVGDAPVDSKLQQVQVYAKEPKGAPGPHLQVLVKFWWVGADQTYVNTYSATTGGAIAVHQTA